MLGGDFMLYTDMSENLKRKFRLHHRCPICHQDVQKYDHCQMVSFFVGSRTCTLFLHTKCLVDSLYVTSKSMVNQQEDEVVYTDTDSVKVIDNQ